MSATVSFDGLASEPTSTDHFHDTSGLYSFELYRIVNIVSYVFAGVSILLSIFIIVSAYVLHRNPRTRHTVNRISFRLMCLSMFAEIVYDAVYLGTYIGDSGSIGSADELTTKSVRLSDRSCSALVYFLFASMGVVNWLFTAIAVNLVLIVVYNISPKQKRLERWYIIASFTLGVGVPFVPAILGHFGQDVYYRTCYFSATEPIVRRVHFLLDIYLWQGLSCLIALFCTIMVLVSLFRTSRNTARALFLFNRQNTETPAQPQTSNAVELKDRYIRTALRISSYPIALVIINGILTAGDLFYNENGGVDDTGQAVFAAIYTWFYGGRGLILALIGIFVDPCLRNGYRARRSPAYGPPVVSTLAPPQALQNNATSAKSALTARRPPEPWRRRSSEVMELSYDPPSTGSGSQQTDSYKYSELDPEIQLHVEYPPTASVDSDEAEKLYGEVEAQL